MQMIPLPRHFDRSAAEWSEVEKSHTLMAQAALRHDISRLRISIKAKVLTTHNGAPAQDNQNGRRLTVRQKP